MLQDVRMKRRFDDVSPDDVCPKNKRMRRQGLKRSRSRDTLLDEQPTKRFCVYVSPSWLTTMLDDYLDPDTNVPEVEAYLCHEWSPRFVI